MADYSITGDTRLDTSGFKNGVSSMTVAAGNLIADFVKSAGSQLAGLAKSVVSAGSAFETSLAKVGTIADAGKLSTQELSDQITSMSSRMGVAASDIAEAAYQAISAGQDTTNAVEFAGKASKLAAAGFTSSASAVDILTTALNAYGMSADQADHVSDVLLTTQNLGKTSVDELSASMGKVIPLAAAYGVSVENLSSGLAVMTANGIATAEATTYTKSMLNELGDSGSKVGKILQAQTGKSFAELNAEGKSLGDVLQILYDSVGNDGTAFAGLWSSVEAGTGALSLASGGADKFNSVLAQMQDSAGATETAYETMTDTFQHKVESIQTLAENLGISLYSSLESSLSDVAQWGVDCLTELSDALTEGGPEAMMQAAGSILADLASSITDAIPTLLTSATEVVTNFVDYLGSHADEIVDAGIRLIESLVIGITDNLPALIESAAALLANFAAALLARLPDILACGAAILTSIVDGILYSIANLGEAALACVAKLLGVWDGSMDEWGHIGENIVKGLLDGIKGAWNSLTKWVSDGIKGLISGVKGLLGIHSPSKVFDEIGLNICRGLAQGLTDNTDLTEDAAKQVVASVTDTTETLVDGIQTTTQTVTEILTDGTTQQKRVITETQDEIIDGALVTVERVKTIAADGTEQVTEQIKASAADSLDGLWKELQTRADTGLLGTFSDLYSAVKKQDWASIGKWAASAIYGGLTADQKQQIEKYALGLVDQLNTALQGYQTQIAAKAWDIGTQICEGLTHGFADVWQQAQTLGTTLRSVFTGLKEPLSTAALAISNGLSGGLLSSFPSIYAGVAGMVGTVGAAFEALLTSISAALNATLFGIPLGVVVAAAAVALGIAIASICASLGGSSSGSSAGVSGGSKKTIASTTDISTSVGEDGTKTVVKTVTETLQDEAGELSQRITKTVTETSTKLVDGVQRSCETVTTYVDGIVQRVDTTLKDLEQTAASTDTTQPDNTPDKPNPGTGDLEDAINANTKALEKSNAALAEMVRQANSLVLSDNMRLGSTVAASGTSQVAAAARQYTYLGATNITQNIYSKAQTAADLQREARWEADRAKAQKH